MVESNAIEALVKALSSDPQDTNNTYTAIVSRVDNENVIWVNLAGSDKETPTASTSAEVKAGDVVTVEWRNNKLYIAGNTSNPSAGFNTVRPSVDYVNQLVDKDVTVKSITAATGYIDDLYSKKITTENLQATTGYIQDLTSEHITAQDIVSDHAEIGDLDVNYAQINLANVNNAWIDNGVIKDAAISDAQIIGVSANKLTAGTIDAGKINVANLRAKNLIVERLNGQPVFGGLETVNPNSSGYSQKNPSAEGWYEYVNGDFVLSTDTTVDENKVYYKDTENVALYDQTYIDGLEQDLQQQIDGAVETYTGTDVPTLVNYPAVDWSTAQMANHVGDIYYVVNAGSQADGYCYRFAYDSTADEYSWVLIKDSDVTAALQRLIDAEGDISDLQSFESTTTSWMTNTDEELSSVKSNVTSLTTRVTTAEGDIQQKVDTSTFNTLSQTVGENTSNITSLSTITTNNGLTSETNITNTVNSVSQTATGNSSKLSQLTTTLGTNADGTTKAGDIMHRTSDLEQDLDGFKTTVSSTYETKSDASALKSRVSTAESTLTQHASDISARVTQTDFETAINKIEGLSVTMTVSGDNLVFTATLIQGGEDITSTIPNGDFEWFYRTPTGDVPMNRNGKSITIAKASQEYGRTVVCVWTRNQYAYLLNNSGNNLVTNTGNKLVGRSEY